MKPRDSTVPKLGLVLALVCLAIPMGASLIFPDWINDDVGLLIWLLALVPAFLLSYYRSWRGASLALAAGMAAFSVAQVVLLVTDAGLPPPELLLGVVVVLTTVALGSGWIGTLFHRSLDEVERMALTDVGTGLANRRHAILELEKAFAAAERGSPLAVVLFDLDHFKRINDEHGHAAGDDVLARFGELLHSMTRSMNLSARFGGEEFLSVVRNANAAGARRFAERVREGTERLELPYGPVTVSAGVAEYEPGMASPDVLLAAADQALYRAKAAGRNRVAVLDPRGRSSRKRPTPSASSGTGDDGGDGELVLVVDDDEDALRSVARALRRFGYVALESSSPARALEVVRGLDRPVNLLLTDIVMPEMSGFRLVEQLGRVQDEVRVIYMSGYVQDEVDWAGVPGDVHEYLTKPLTISTLGDRVRAVLDTDGEGETGPDGDERTEDRDRTSAAEAGGEADRVPSPTSGGGGSRDGDGESAEAPDAEASGGGPESEEDVLLRRTTEPAGPSSRREDAPAPAPAAPGSGGSEARPGRIVVLHRDDRDGRSLRRLLLDPDGDRRVRLVSDAEAAALHADDRRLDLLVVDLDLPRAPLRDLLTKLEVRSRAGRSVPAVLLLHDGGRNRDLRDVATALERADLLRKPVDRVELENRVRILLRLQRVERWATSAGRRMRDRLSARTAELEEAREEILRRLAWAAEYRDDVTGRHAERVGIVSGVVARQLGWSRDRLNLLEQAAPLHDLGKIAIPDAVLHKPGALTPSERSLIESHTTIGAKLLSGSRNPLLREARRIALHHHERWDGGGYPEGLEGEAIPMSARIVAVADTYDSMLHHRPYRDGQDREACLREIREGAGGQFDPAVVEAFLASVESGALDDALHDDLVARPDDRPTASEPVATQERLVE